MPLDLHTATVGAYLQILPSAAGLVGKAEEHCRGQGLPPATLLEASLAPDMWPFARQVAMVVLHSAGAIEAVRSGVFRPSFEPAATSFEALRGSVDQAIASLQAVDPSELESLAGRDARFEFGETVLPFTVEDFLLTFSLPNFYFHAATAYGILRNQGLAVGKMDFMGKLRLKGRSPAAS